MFITLILIIPENGFDFWRLTIFRTEIDIWVCQEDIREPQIMIIGTYFHAVC